jgi:hypothetical protein
VLLSDQQSYFSQPAALFSTNRLITKTNLLSGSNEIPRLGPMVVRQPAAALTNSAPARPGFIVELCVPGEAEVSRQMLSDLVNGLKQQRLFSKVDLLSDDLRRNLADAKVSITDRDFVLALDFAEIDFQQPAHWKRPSALGPIRTQPKRSPRPPWSTSDTGTSDQNPQ